MRHVDDPDGLGGAPVRGVVGVVVAGVVVASVAGCSGSSKPAAVSSKPAVVVTATETVSGSPSVSASSSEAEKAKVEAAYRAFWGKLTELARGPRVTDTHALDGVATANHVPVEFKALNGLFGGGAHMIGSVELQVRSVSVSGGKATLTACFDHSRWVSVPLSQATVKPGEIGGTNDPVQAVLVRDAAGVWRLDDRDDATGFTCP